MCSIVMARIYFKNSSGLSSIMVLINDCSKEVQRLLMKDEKKWNVLMEKFENNYRI